MFITLFGYWVQGGGGVKRDWYTTCFCSFSACIAQIEVSETYFYDIVIT